jgi:hypothetical protein
MQEISRPEGPTLLTPIHVPEIPESPILESSVQSDESGFDFIIAADIYNKVNFLMQQGAYQFLEPELFPELELHEIETARFFATSNAIATLHNAKHLTSNPQLREKIDIKATQLAMKRDERYLNSMVAIEGETDPDLIIFQAKKRWMPDRIQMLMNFVGEGLVDEITPETFPELLGFSKENRAYLRLKASINHMDAITNLTKEPGNILAFDHNRSVQTTPQAHDFDSTGTLKRAAEQHKELLQTYLSVSNPSPSGS